MTTPADDQFDPALFKSIAAALGIDVEVTVDAFGRTDLRLDRTAMETIRDAARRHGFPELAYGVQQLLDRGGHRT